MLIADEMLKMEVVFLREQRKRLGGDEFGLRRKFTKEITSHAISGWLSKHPSQKLIADLVGITWEHNALHLILMASEADHAKFLRAWNKCSTEAARDTFVVSFFSEVAAVAAATEAIVAFASYGEEE